MNKRKAKKQKRLKAIRLLENMGKYKCCALVPSGEGHVLILLDNASLEIETHLTGRPYASMVPYRLAEIRGEIYD